MLERSGKHRGPRPEWGRPPEAGRQSGRRRGRQRRRLGGLWGTLIGLLFLNPLAGLLTGAALGAGAGALSAALSDYGIDGEFIRSLGSTIEPGSSALFTLVRRATFDKVLDELRPFGGTILRTSLSREQEERLKKALEGVKEEVTA